MTRWQVVVRGVCHHWRSYLTLLFGTALAGTVLVGSLLVGTSVRYSLRRLVDLRLGEAEFAVVSGDNFVKDDLGKRLGAKSAALIAVPGVAGTAGGDRRANRIQLLGVDSDFFALFPNSTHGGGVEATQALLSENLARHLAVAVGETVILRFEKEDGMPKGSPLSRSDEGLAVLRLTVAGILDADSGGRFSLRAEQIAPFNVFLDRGVLAKALGVAGRANLVLSTEKPRLEEVLTFADANLELRRTGNGEALELRSPRVFLPPRIRRKFSGDQFLTYLANEIRVGGRSVPYSFVSGGDAAWLPALEDGGIAVNRWLADELAAKIGDSLQLTYYRFGEQRKLVEERATFRVAAIVPLEKPFADPGLMPDFPGMADSEDCSDWEAGVPLDFDRIRPQDEEYWDKYRGTPKAFVSLPTARKLWTNPYGDCTAIRLSQTAEELQAMRFSANDLALQTLAIREAGLRASAKSVDFGGLFIGLSFFLIVAALLLVALLFSLTLQRRRQERGTLVALGFNHREIRALFFAEAAFSAIGGAVAGVCGGVLCCRLIVFALTTVWRGTVGTTELVSHTTLPPLLVGGGATVMIILGAFFRVLRKEPAVAPPLRTVRHSRFFAHPLFLLFAPLIAVSIRQFCKGEPVVAFIFGTVFLFLLLAYEYFCRRNLSPLTGEGDLGQRYRQRNPGRSSAVVAILACAVFLVVSIGTNRIGYERNPEKRSSGTGGFTWFAETALPLFDDWEGPVAQRRFGLGRPPLDQVDCLPFLVAPGDEASCLNLNRPAMPRLVGVEAGRLADLEAFRFKKSLPLPGIGQPWKLLDHRFADGAIPAIADAEVILWSLGKKLGDDLVVVGGDGEEHTLRLVAGLAPSVMQGNLVISKAHFRRLFPGIGGANLFLLSAPPSVREAAAIALRRSFRDLGIELTSCRERLETFATVQNTYLAIFLALGVLALLLGTVGLGLVILRNMEERSGEFALLRAVGFSQGELFRLLVHEHLQLFIIGLCIGLGAGFCASPPGWSLLPIFAGILLNGLFWIYLSARMALRRDLLAALRRE